MSHLRSTGAHDDERTPLLGRGNSHGHLVEDSRNGGLVEGTASPDPASVVEGGLAVQPIPESAQSKADYGSSQATQEPQNDGSQEDVREKKNPYMGGVGVTQFWVAFISICLQILITNFDSTLMASSHPVITSYFNASNAAAWLSTAFLLTSTAFQPLFGRVSDTIGRKWLHLASLFVFGLATAGCALAPTIGVFIAGRAVAGLAGGGVTAMGSIMINDMVPIEIRGVFQSYLNLFFGAGSAAGAAFGGFLCDRLGWRWTFGMQVPVVAVVMILSAFTIPSSLGPHLARNSDKTARQLIANFDITGSILLTLTVGLLILGLNVGGAILPWNHPLVITSLVLALVSIPFLGYAEKRAERAVMPLWILSRPPHANLVLSNFFSMVGINTILFNAPLFFQAVLLDTPSMSGFRLTAPWIAATVCGVSAGFIMTATRRMKPLLVIGSFSMLIGAILLTAMWPTIPPWLATAFLVPPNIGQGLAFPATSLAVLATCKQEDQAVVTSTLILNRSLGTVLGVSVSSLIVQNALWQFLEQNVTGEGREEVIRLARKSVEAVRDLKGIHQEQVIEAYRQTLTLTFGSAIVMFSIVVGLLLAIKLPRLGEQGGSR
ncbi:MAG: hypothetical protein Q9165_005957 [Trypethelium subeluteriae]